MNPINSGKLLFLWFLLCTGRAGSVTENLTCPSTNSTNQGLEWPAITTTTSSNPLCVDRSRQLASRIQPGALPQCPENFTDAINICYFLTAPSTYPPPCPYPNTVPFNSYKDIVSTNGTPIWMPIRRDLSNGLGFLEWVEASDLYKVEYNGDFFVFDTIKEKDCLIYYNSTYVVLVSCKEQHLGVCAYHKLDQMNDQMCRISSSDTCIQSDFNPDAMCFCVGGEQDNQTDYNNAEFPKPYQNNVYASLTCDPCTIGLQRTQDDSYIWTTSRREIDYTYWSPNTNFSTGNSHGAATNDGWVLTDAPLPCFIFQLELTYPAPKLVLRFSNITGFLLKISNPKGLVHANSHVLMYCFSNAGALSLTYRYETLSQIETIEEDAAYYEFLPHNQGPGNYWCEAFNYLTSEPITSDVLFVNQSERFGAEFVAILNTQYIGGTNPLSGGMIEFLERIFFIKIKLEQDEPSKCSYTSRLMKIVDIDEENNTALVNIHFTCVASKKSVNLAAASFSDEEFDRMQTLINQTINDLGGLNFELIDFMSATYCLEESTFGLSWPRTELNQSTHCREFCFNSEGMQLSRRCDGDFINGARWADPGTCTLPQTSTVTEELLNILHDSDNILDAVYNVSSRFTEFDSLDVYLVALISEQHWREMDIDKFVRVLDNVLKVNDSALGNAQEEMRAMDILLDTLDHVAVLGDITSDNLVTVSNSSGIVLRSDQTIVNLTGVNDLESIIETFPDLEGAIWLSSDFSSTQQVTFKVFYNDAFFCESESILTRSVFGVSSTETFNGSIRLLYQRSNDNTNPGDCAFWNYDLEAYHGRGVWKTTNQTKNFLNFILCDFSNVDATAITVIPRSDSNNENVTNNLQDLLESSESPSDVIDKLSNISDRYDEFTSDDVFLVGEILAKFRNCTDIDLQALAHIVSNLHEIERSILSDSQKKAWATDSILHSVDVIIKNHNYVDSVNIIEDNFIIMITNMIDTDFSGLVLFEDNHKLNILNLTGNITIGEVLDHDNLISALYVPAGLKQQLGNDSKIIVTIFSSDGLFNENDTTFQYVSKIFGIIIPLMEDYVEPLSLIHRVATEPYEQNCVYWSYDNARNVTGIWKKDNDGKNLATFSRCDFWHTTHFALLLLDSDGYDYATLDWITTINCGLSMFGLCCIVLTSVLFKRWRTNSGNQILLHFVFASILQICIFYASSSINQNSSDYLLCTIIGVVLHYSIVSQFCWMFVIAVLQFKRFVEVLRGPPKHVLLKACLCGWMLPCLPVACVYFLDNDTYVAGNVGLCYPSGLGLYLGVWLPIAIVVAINCVIFVYIMYSVVWRKTECSDVGSGEGMFQWRLAILLFFMLGMTWCFGFLSELEFGVVFVYAFCITATLQGFVMFLFFIVFNSNTRYLYTQACNKNRKKY